MMVDTDYDEKDLKHDVAIIGAPTGPESFDTEKKETPIRADDCKFSPP